MLSITKLSIKYLLRDYLNMEINSYMISDDYMYEVVISKGSVYNSNYPDRADIRSL